MWLGVLVFFIVSSIVNFIIIAPLFEKPRVKRVDIPELPVLTDIDKETQFETIAVEMSLPMKEAITQAITHSLYRSNLRIKSPPREITYPFPETYSYIPGILTFRGNNLRNGASFGVSEIKRGRLRKIWTAETDTAIDVWGGSAGWTGQPVVIRWPMQVRNIMNIDDKFKTNNGFTEVILGSLDGRIYFFELESGKHSRPPIVSGNPIKGSVSVDPRGYPLLYVGEGLNFDGRQKFKIFSLIDGELLFETRSFEPMAPRFWYGFDSSAIVNRNTDTLLVGGENGLFYAIRLNTLLDLSNGDISINPDVYKYAYFHSADDYEYGIENSPAVYKNLMYFADNSGTLQCIDLNIWQPVWIKDVDDDTDATIVLEIQDGRPYLYTACEVDKQGAEGYSHIRKVDGLNGETVWKRSYRCVSTQYRSGGALATPALGKGNMESLVIFTLSFYERTGYGLMVAIDKSTGEEVWRRGMPYSWSSPVVFTDKNRKGYIIQADSAGNVALIDGISGKTLHKLNLKSNFQASPVFFEDYIIIAGRGRQIFALRVE
jgi:hypothetical protein